MISIKVEIFAKDWIFQVELPDLKLLSHSRFESRNGIMFIPSVMKYAKWPQEFSE